MSIVSDILNTAALRLTRIHPDNGFGFEVHKVWLPHQDGEEYTPEHLAMVVTAGDQQRETDNDRPGNPPAHAYRLPIKIKCDVIKSKFDQDKTWDHVASIVHSNAVRAIADWPDWHQFDGNCFNAEIQAPTYNKPTDDGGIGSVAFSIDAMFRVAETNPELLRA